jgi:hypothetical protein
MCGLFPFGLGDVFVNFLSEVPHPFAAAAGSPEK